MITLLIAALVSSAPAITAPESGFGGELVATWTHEDAKAHTAISLDADGGCSVISRNKRSGKVHNLMCAYWTVGSTIHLRFKNPQARGPRAEIALSYDAKADELIATGDATARFGRASLTARDE